MRRRAREHLATSVRQEIDLVRLELQETFTQTLAIVQRDVSSARETEAWERTESNAALTKALERVADALDGVGQHLQLDRKDRSTQAMTVEFLLRELVVSMSNPVPDVPSILGGTIEPALGGDSGHEPGHEPEHEREHGTVIDDGYAVGAAVEVRSRFQQRWVGGFLVADVVADDTGRRYRLLRRSDRELLPVTFGDTDLRPAARAAPTGEPGARADSREHHGAVTEEQHAPLDVRLHRA
jgi:hypothetical protein